MLSRSTRSMLWAAGAGTISLLASAVSIRLTTDVLRLPWGRGTWSAGDAALMYMTASTMVRFGWISQNPDVGFPSGMDLAHIPFAEIHQWSTLRLVSLFTDNPILALNAFFLFGFFAVGFASFLLFDATLGNRWLAVALAVALATIPWHFSRFHHTLLADYSPVPVFLLLAYRMWTDWWLESRKRLALGVLGSVYVATAGVYYAFFACLILGPVLLVRITSHRGVRQWWRDALIVLTIPVFLAGSLLAHRSLAASQLSGMSLVERVPMMSFGFAGVGPSLLAAWPFYDSEKEGAAQFSMIVALAFLVAIVALVALTIGAIRGHKGLGFSRIHAELRPWFMLLVWTLLWYLPGLGLLFASTITPEIRSWGRLSVVVAYIVTVVLGILLAHLVRFNRTAALAVTAGLVGVLGWQIAQDHRPLTIPRRSTDLDAASSMYAVEIGRVLDSGCPVLQLPALEFPEEWREEWRDVGMAAYDHMWVQIYAPEFRWSFGAPRGSLNDAEAQARYSAVPISEQLENARMDGFCAVHADARGLGAREEMEIRGLLGEPAVEVGRWALYPLDPPSPQRPVG